MFQENLKNMKTITILLFCIIQILSYNIILAQKLNCHDLINSTVIEDIEKDIDIVYNDYIDNFDAIKNSIILIDYARDDSLKIFRVYVSIDVFKLFYKKPDCFFVKDTRIAYIYTDNYAADKDTVWLETALGVTAALLLDFSGDVIINWEKDSIVKIVGSSVHPVIFYDPCLIEYKVYEGKIISKRYADKMLYPHVSKPKGIMILPEPCIHPY